MLPIPLLAVPLTLSSLVSYTWCSPCSSLKYPLNSWSSGHRSGLLTVPCIFQSGPELDTNVAFLFSSPEILNRIGCLFSWIRKESHRFFWVMAQKDSHKKEKQEKKNVFWWRFVNKRSCVETWDFKTEKDSGWLWFNLEGRLTCYAYLHQGVVSKCSF